MQWTAGFWCGLFASVGMALTGIWLYWKRVVPPLGATGTPKGLHDDAVVALALGWHPAHYRPRLLDLPERLAVRAKLDRQLGPEAARSEMFEMTRQYVGNAMLRRGWGGDSEDDVEAREWE